MAITLEGTRFGDLEIDDDAQIDFPKGLIGLPGSRYALLSGDSEGAFLWLQSLEDPDLALPVTHPGLFFEDYVVDISDADAERIGFDGNQADHVLVTVRAAEEPKDFRANLVAPILVAGGQGWQVLNEQPGLLTRAPLFA